MQGRLVDFNVFFHIFESWFFFVTTPIHNEEVMQNKVVSLPRIFPFLYICKTGILFHLPKWIFLF